MKNIVKFKFLEQEGFLSCVEKDGEFLSLVKKDTSKVASINDTKKLLISHELKTPIYQEMDVEVSFDEALIAWVFNKLDEEKNLYFKALDETLCVLIIKM